MQIIHAVLYCLITALLLTSAGNSLSRLLFRATGLQFAPQTGTADQAFRAGWVIGGLERLLIALGIIAQSWEVLAAVVALKTVARFRELDEKRFAEYFLVGSLFSLLWAAAVTGAFVAYDGHFGSDLRGQLVQALAPADAPK